VIFKKESIESAFDARDRGTTSQGGRELRNFSCPERGRKTP